MRVDISTIRGSLGAAISARGTVHVPGDVAPGVDIVNPVGVELTLTNAGRSMHVEGRLDLVIETSCVRCLEPVRLDLHVPFAHDYAHESRLAAGEDADGDFDVFTGDCLELDPAVAEAVILSIPVKTLCRDDCPGLCPRCGRDLKEGKCDCQPEDDRGLVELPHLSPKKEV